MALDTTPLFDAPIPGMSLTHELGARPWQQPAQYPTVDEAIQYYMDKMTSDEFMDQLIDVVEMGIPVADIANIMQVSSVMEGVHSLDVGVLVAPVLMEMIMFIAESADAEYVTGLDEPTEGQVSKAKMAKIMQELEQEVGNIEQPEETETAKVEQADSENKPKGLMGRRQ
tara:strand:+ start:2186 stop:2695 length:510 start_codon:yes stop_codon:yes gene_type:complete